MNTQTVLVKFKNQYGRMVCHPVNEQAKVFAAISGTKTLTYHTLKGIDYLGFKIATAHDMYSYKPSLNIYEVKELLSRGRRFDNQ